MPKIRKVVTVRFVAEVDSDEWAEEYNLDPADVQGIQYDVSQWLRYGTDTALTEMPGSANTLRVVETDVQITSSEVVGDDDGEPGRRIKVTWQTEEVREYEEIIAVPDEVGDTDEDIAEWIDDGNNPTLIAVERHAAYDLPSFLRDMQEWEHVKN